MRNRSEKYRVNNNKGNLARYYAKHSLNPNRAKNAYKSLIKRLYGLTEKDYLDLYNKQSGLCRVCSIFLYNPFDRQDGDRPQLDHCHKTNKVRGILCQTCNTGLGSFKDDPKLLRQGADYLEESNNRC